MKRTEGPSELQLVALSLSPNIGAKTLNNLLRHFKHDLDAVFAASPSELMQVSGIGKTIAREITGIDLCQVECEIAAWREKDIQLLTRCAAGYPAPLYGVNDSPPALFASRALPPEIWAKAVAIVGTRNPSKEARYITLELAMKLVRAGYTVTSGLALGIDTAAHTGALSAKGVTIAVLGSGILNVYPESNRRLADRIREDGALVSEVHPLWGANAQRLVARNRIISGLSQAVILVESNIDGGAMYTAHFAAEQGRPIYTFDLPAGGNQELIKRGAFVLKRDDPLGFLLR